MSNDRLNGYTKLNIYLILFFVWFHFNTVLDWKVFSFFFIEDTHSSYLLNDKLLFAFFVAYIVCCCLIFNEVIRNIWFVLDFWLVMYSHKQIHYFNFSVYWISKKKKKIYTLTLRHNFTLIFVSFPVKFKQLIELFLLLAAVRAFFFSFQLIKLFNPNDEFD